MCADYKNSISMFTFGTLVWQALRGQILYLCNIYIYSIYLCLHLFRSTILTKLMPLWCPVLHAYNITVRDAAKRYGFLVARPLREGGRVGGGGRKTETEKERKINLKPGEKALELHLCGVKHFLKKTRNYFLLHPRVNVKSHSAWPQLSHHPACCSHRLGRGWRGCPA